jgi:hypothetical protein
MRTLLICHADAALHHDGLARWMAAHTTLTGMVLVHETGRTLWRRAKREVRRVGALRFLDVLAFRLYDRLFLRARDDAWARERLTTLRAQYPPVPPETPLLRVRSPNSAEAAAFMQHCAPDLTLALCKVLLKPHIYSIPPKGTYVLHPGICPEYRNAHGCFWALANDDLGMVGMTLLRIDEGIDTGPVYGYFTYDYDELRESHTMIQHRVVLDSLEALRQKLDEIETGTARPLETAGRQSAVWGQPWLTRYLHWKSNARRRSARAGHRVAVS